MTWRVIQIRRELLPDGTSRYAVVIDGVALPTVGSLEDAVDLIHSTGFGEYEEETT